MAKVIHGKGIARLRKEFESLKRAKLEVGYFDTARYPDGTPVAYIAAIHEFGYAGKNIPARPFMRPTIAKKKQEWVKYLQGGFKRVANGQMTVNDVLTQMGGAIAGQINESIVAVTEPPLKDATVAARKRKLSDGGKGAKGSISKPLVATGVLTDLEYSLTYKVTL